MPTCCQVRKMLSPCNNCCPLMRGVVRMLTFPVRLLLSPPPLNIPPSGQRPSIFAHVGTFVPGASLIIHLHTLWFLPGLQYALLAPCQSGCQAGHPHLLPPYIPPPYSPPPICPPLSSDLRATGWPFPPRGLARWSTSLLKTNQPSPSISTSTADQNYLAAPTLLSSAPPPRRKPLPIINLYGMGPTPISAEEFEMRRVNEVDFPSHDLHQFGAQPFPEQDPVNTRSWFEIKVELSLGLLSRVNRWVNTSALGSLFRLEGSGHVRNPFLPPASLDETNLPSLHSPMRSKVQTSAPSFAPASPRSLPWPTSLRSTQVALRRSERIHSANGQQASILAESGFDCHCAKPLSVSGECANEDEWALCYQGWLTPPFHH
jgi:hypothetical protein